MVSLLGICSALGNPVKIQPIDTSATPQTQALLEALHRLAPTKTLFGHQNTLATGYHWRNEPHRSDIEEVTGSFPAVYGWDLMDILPAETGRDDPGYTADDILAWCRSIFERGGVVTFSWHARNPNTGNNYSDLTPAVSEILHGGKRHEAFLKRLQSFAAFAKQLEPYPIIFRPLHEHNGDWFWWGKGLCSEDEYIALWRMVVDELRGPLEVHNLLYAFSPDRSRMDLDAGSDAYFYGYPGDAYVDIFGLDNYWDVGHPANKASPSEQQVDFIRSLTLLGKLAVERGKVAALTETGEENLPRPNWFTRVLLQGLEANPGSKQIAYAMIWRNAPHAFERIDHFYAPYTGHSAAKDLVAFKRHPSIVFQDNLPQLYHQTH